MGIFEEYTGIPPAEPPVQKLVYVEPRRPRWRIIFLFLPLIPVLLLLKESETGPSRGISGRVRHQTGDRPTSPIEPSAEPTLISTVPPQVVYFGVINGAAVAGTATILASPGSYATMTGSVTWATP